MARQEATNTFEEGMIMDLNPINTPKSVVSDCLNGTFITYNGNEFLLQNDMGNYKLENCKLPTNFIPVGVKGYADILYIVSYNPLTKEVEIGSYPAPQSIFTTGDSENLEAGETDLQPFIVDGTERYTDVITNQKHPLFIFTSSDEETYKLYPGDEFRMDGLDYDTPDYIYQHLDFYVIDDDNKIYDIDDEEIHDTSNTDENGWRKVFWETPGWLAAQWDLYVPDKFNLNLRSLNVPEFIVQESSETSILNTTSIRDYTAPSGTFVVSMDLSAQITITDLLFQSELNNNWDIDNSVFEHLYTRFLIKSSDGNYGTFLGIASDDGDFSGTEYSEDSTYLCVDIPCKKHNYQDDITTAYTNAYPVWQFTNPEGELQDYDGQVELIAFPVIKQGNSILEFRQFETTLQYDLNSLKDGSSITIANSVYKWSVDDDSCTISFNINGPFINSSNITGRYEIYRVNLFKSADTDDIYSWSRWDDIVSDSQNGDLAILSSSGNDDIVTILSNTTSYTRTSITQATNRNFYYSSGVSRLLMCEGDISSLVLYGQNTINVEFSGSNKFTLTNFVNTYNDGTTSGTTDPEDKVIDFSKEGGIYIFRVIIEQSGNTLTTQELPLIPSETFNDWFGSLDNYLDESSGVSSSMWISRWLESYTSGSSVINNITVTEKTDNTIVLPIQWKLGSESTWNDETVVFGLRYGSYEIVAFHDVFENFFPSSDEFGDDFSTVFSSAQNDSIQVRVSLADLYTAISTSSSSGSGLTGNLWNPLFRSTITLYSGTTEMFTINNDGVDLSSLYFTWNYSLTSNGGSNYRLTENTYYPFESLSSSDKPIVIFRAHSGDRTYLNVSVYYKTIESWNAGYAQISDSTAVENDVTVTSTNNLTTTDDFFTTSYTALGNLNSDFALLNLSTAQNVNGNRTGYVTAFCEGSDWNTGMYKLYDGWNDTWYDREENHLMLFKTKKQNERVTNNSTVAVYFTSTINDTLYDSVFSHIYVKENGDLGPKYVIFLEATDNTISYNNTLNYYRAGVSLYSLRVDDYYLATNTLHTNLDDVYETFSYTLFNPSVVVSFSQSTSLTSLGGNYLFSVNNTESNEIINTITDSLRSVITEINAESSTIFNDMQTNEYQYIVTSDGGGDSTRIDRLIAKLSVELNASTGNTELLFDNDITEFVVAANINNSTSTSLAVLKSSSFYISPTVYYSYFEELSI